MEQNYRRRARGVKPAVASTVGPHLAFANFLPQTETTAGPRLAFANFLPQVEKGREFMQHVDILLRAEEASAYGGLSHSS